MIYDTVVSNMVYNTCNRVISKYASIADLVEWCNVNVSRDGYYTALTTAAVCSPWVVWIGGNAVVHFTWVGMLLGCQLYQV